MCKRFFLAATVVVAVSAHAGAATLNADGDFGAQAVGSPVAAPWDPVGGTHTVTAEAQSPFTNVYSDNGRGASMTSTGENSYLVDFFSPVTADTAPTLYYNVDFRITDDSGAIRRFQIGQGAGVSDALTFFVSDTTFLVCDNHYGNGGFHSPEVITDQLTPGQWYNVQLEVDLANRSYSGVVASHTESFSIGARNLMVSWDGTIDDIHTDNTGVADVGQFCPFDDSPDTDRHGSTRHQTNHQYRFQRSPRRRRRVRRNPRRPRCPGRRKSVQRHLRGFARRR